MIFWSSFWWFIQSLWKWNNSTHQSSKNYFIQFLLFHWWEFAKCFYNRPISSTEKICALNSNTVEQLYVSKSAKMLCCLSQNKSANTFLLVYLNLNESDFYDWEGWQLIKCLCCCHCLMSFSCFWLDVDAFSFTSSFIHIYRKNRAPTFPITLEQWPFAAEKNKGIFRIRKVFR